MSSPQKVSIPEAYRDLLERPVTVIFTSILPTNAPHSTPTWRRWDGEYVLVTVDKSSQKYKNVIRNPNVSIMALDPQNTGRYLEVRGVVEDVTHEGAIEELNRHTKMYTGKDTYYGGIEPAERLSSYEGVIIKIRPTKIVNMG
jgi:PPOX class probable F420-dependent enzyme